MLNLSLASMAKLLIPVFGMGSAPALVPTADFGVMYKSTLFPPCESSTSTALSTLISGALYLLSFSIKSSTCPCNWKLSSAAWFSCLLHSSLISWITACSSFLKPSMPFFAYSTVSSTIRLQSASRLPLSSENLCSYWAVIWATFWLALCSASSATAFAAFFSFAFASLSSCLSFATSCSVAVWDIEYSDTRCSCLRSASAR